MTHKQPNSLAWWRYGYVWLLIAGPAAVILASIAAAYLAISRPDPAIDDYYRKGTEINRTLAAQANSLAPALQARNHAATGLHGQPARK